MLSAARTRRPGRDLLALSYKVSRRRVSGRVVAVNSGARFSPLRHGLGETHVESLRRGPNPTIPINKKGRREEPALAYCVRLLTLSVSCGDGPNMVRPRIVRTS